MKITHETHETLRKLVSYAAKHGWMSLGSDRDDPPTQAAMIEEAVRYFARATAKLRSTGR